MIRELSGKKVAALVRSDHREMPGLSLSKAQLCRLWGLDSETCSELIESLVAEGFLRRTPSELYMRSDVRP